MFRNVFMLDRVWWNKPSVVLISQSYVPIFAHVEMQLYIDNFIHSKLISIAKFWKKRILHDHEIYGWYIFAPNSFKHNWKNFKIPSLICD